MKPLRSFILGFCFLLAASAVSASFISLKTALTAKVEGNNLKVQVNVVNKGDESAYNVQADLRLAGRQLLAAQEPELPVNGTYQATATVPLSLATPGSYPLLVLMHYTDANQYPFSALNGQTYIYKQGTPPAEIIGQVEPTTFWQDGQIKLRLKNLSDSALTVKLLVVAPRELAIDGPSRQVDLAARSEKQLTYTAKNFSALSGSNYQVFAVCEYEQAGLHYASFFPGMVKIAAEEKLFGLSYPIIFSILAVLVMIFIGAQFLFKGVSRE